MEQELFAQIYLDSVRRNLNGFEILQACDSVITAERMWRIAERLVDNAQKFNLTSILQPEEIVKKHIVDSIVPLGVLVSRGYFAGVDAGSADSTDSDNLADSTDSAGLPSHGGFAVADVGTGAGFPLLPMAAAALEYFPRGRVSFTGIDSTAKKLAHVRETAEFAGLDNVNTVEGRAEVLGRFCPFFGSGDSKPGNKGNNKKFTSSGKYGGKRGKAESSLRKITPYPHSPNSILSPSSLRESFSLTCARAVSALPVLLELLAPLTRVGGIVAALKSHAEDEIAAAGCAPEILGLVLRDVVSYSLDGEDHRELLIYEKIRGCEEKYPRQYADIIKHPLK